MRAMFFLAAVAVMGALCAAEKPYTCSLKVGTPKLEQKAEEAGAEDKAAKDKAPAKGKAAKGKAAKAEEPAAEAPKKGKAAKGKAAKGKAKVVKAPEPKIPAGSKVMRRKMIWPVTVSFQGKDFPSDARLRFTYIGTKDGAPAILGKDDIDVALDKNGIFKKDVASPEAVMVKTRKSTGGGKKGGGTTSETTGERLAGCVVQLIIGDEVVRSYATKPPWAKLAKKNPLPEEEILKFR